MVNLFIVFNFDHSYQKECLFLFFKEDPKPSSHITQRQKTRRRLTICDKPNATAKEKIK